MHTATTVYRFGPFDLDPATGRLFRGITRIPFADPHAAILRHLVAHPGHVLSKDALAAAGWGSVAVGDDAVKQAILRLRKALGQQPGGTLYIETVSNRGYRFAAPVARGERMPVADTSPDEQFAPYRAFVQGQLELDTLDREAIRRARLAFIQALQLAPDYAPAHVGLANAWALTYESTRVDVVCDVGALRQAIDHARWGTKRAPSSGEAWSTLAFALFLNREIGDARAAAYKAIALEPGDWRHRLRLAYINWGEARMGAACEALKMCPGLALAHWLKTTVLIARGALDLALDEVRAGCALQDSEAATAGVFPAVGLHLLHGLVLVAQDRLDDAVGEFERELGSVGVSGSSRTNGQVYARECAANTWYALGAVRLRQRRPEEADGAFRRALTGAPGHLPSAAALGHQIPELAASDPRVTDAAIARAIALARAGRHGEAAQAYRKAIEDAPVPSAGWILPVEPLLNPSAHPGVWSELLALVRHRAR